MKKIAILGTSNTIKANGYPNFLSKMQTSVQNLGIGDVSGLYAIYYLSKNSDITDTFDYIIFDYCINEITFLNNDYFSEDNIIFNTIGILSFFINTKAKPIFLLLSPKNNDHTHFETYKNILNFFKIDYIDLYKEFSEVDKDKLYESNTHYSAHYQKIIANKIFNFISNDSREKKYEISLKNYYEKYPINFSTINKKRINTINISKEKIKSSILEDEVLVLTEKSAISIQNNEYPLGVIFWSVPNINSTIYLNYFDKSVVKNLSLKWKKVLSCRSLQFISNSDICISLSSIDSKEILTERTHNEIKVQPELKKCFYFKDIIFASSSISDYVIKYKQHCRNFNNFSWFETFDQILNKEINSILLLKNNISKSLIIEAVNFIYNCHGKIIVTGVGKSGHIASKIAATLASTGTPSFFVHPGEACHGDLGMIEPNDLIIAISHSGESSEIMTILPICKNRGNKIIAITSNPNSSMAKIADIHLCTYVTEEAGPLNLAPTSSTTVTLVLGDALAIALADRRNFTKEDFAASHPGGVLGKKLLVLNENIMHTGNQIPLVKTNQSVAETIIEITEKKLGFAIVINEDNNKLVGIFTDGDLRRTLAQNIDLNNTKIGDVAHTNCITVRHYEKAADSLKLMQDNCINGLVVISDDEQVLGAINIHDLIAVGIK